MYRRLLLLICLALGCPAAAGPPFVTDDPQPTDTGHFEIYLFDQGGVGRDGVTTTGGVDFNYGALTDLQLTAVLPLEVQAPAAGPAVAGLGNIELAAKYKIFHQEDIGWDVAVFPRVFLPSASSLVGDKHASLLLPIWVQKDIGPWSTFGGGGCVINRGGDSQDYCLMGLALTRHVLPDLLLGLEVVHQGADTKGGRVFTGAGAGLIYDLSERIHLLAYGGPGLQNAGASAQTSWYTSVLFTF